MMIDHTGLTGPAATWFFTEVARVASNPRPGDEVAMVERSGAAGAMAPHPRP